MLHVIFSYTGILLLLILPVPTSASASDVRINTSFKLSFTLYTLKYSRVRVCNITEKLRFCKVILWVKILKKIPEFFAPLPDFFGMFNMKIMCLCFFLRVKTT